MISFDDFKKLDIRIGTIKDAAPVEGSGKLLKLTVDLGNEVRTIVAGIAQWFPPNQIIGKQIPILVNLEPRTLKGIESQGMMLAADHEGKAVLLSPDQKIPSGSIVK